MIEVNENEVIIEHFPDGTQRIMFDNEWVNTYVKYIDVKWIYEHEDELLTLMYVKKHIDRYNYKNKDIYLYLPYVPNARMDRVKNNNDVFTLKYFADIINSLNFKEIVVEDVHSDVSTALIDRCRNCLSIYQIASKNKRFKTILDDDNIVVYYPDSSAMKKYHEIEGLKNHKYIYGSKTRDWNTGKITGLSIVNEFGINLKDKTILMVDDIISYGGSMSYGANKLKEMGVGDIYVYASHVENSILDKEKGTLIKLLEDETVKYLFTSDEDIFTKEHKKIIKL